MKTAEWVLQCIGLYGNGDYLDEIEKDFEIEFDLSDDETVEIVSAYAPNVGNRLAEMMYDKIIDKAVEKLNANEEDFGYYCNGSLDTRFYYKQEEVNCWEDIVKLSKQK